jgi:hypothetical protein
MRRLAVIVLAGALALAGCSSPPVSVSAVPRLTEPDAVVTYPRPFQAARLVEAKVRTVGGLEGTVVSARLESPYFADSPPRDVSLLLAADWDNRVRVPLGAAVCPAAEGASMVVLTVEFGGRTETESVEVDDAVLKQINADECAALAVVEVASPSFGPIASQDAREIETTIVLTRGDSRPDAPVALDAMTGNIVFTVALDDAAPRTLAAREGSLSVPAVVTVGRCDPHVFAESKKTWVFPVYLAIDGGEPQFVEFQPDLATRDALQRLFDDCGEAQRSG